jgi:L-threonylcarbamoyladenylate synthase
LNFDTPIGTDLRLAAEILKQGGLVAIPTETVYGLAGNALDALAVARIFEAKQRPHFDPLIVHLRNAEEVLRYAEEFPPAAQRLADNFWPGPLTLVLPRKPIVPELVTAGGPTVALRVPDHPLTGRLLDMLDFPLAAPSANPFGYISPTSAAHVHAQLGGKIDYILDGGPCKVGIESTVIAFEGEKGRILRLGGLDAKAIESLVPELEIQTNSSSNPLSPGQLDRHYAPNTRLVIAADLAKYLHTHNPPENTALIVFSRPQPEWPKEKQFVLSPSNSLTEAAARLYAVLREADAAGYELIIAEEAPAKGLGPAINDRLRRASFRI